MNAQDNPVSRLASDHTLPWLREATQTEMQRAVEALYRVHALMAAMTDLDALLERISEEGRAVANAEAASVMLYDAQSDELYFRVALGDSGNQEALKREVRLKRGQGIAGAAALDGVTIHVPDVEQDTRFFREADAASQFRTRSILAVPMVERNRLVGVLELLNKVGDTTFTALDQHVMEMFSALAASAVVNAQLIEQQIKTERLTAIGQAIAGLTHHIKNILTGLNSSADLIEIALRDNKFDLVSKTWPVLRRSSQRISNFVQDLLLFAKPRTPLIERCDAGRIVSEACETMRDLFRHKKVELQVFIPETGIAVHADPDALYRCLMNLIGNAIDAAPESTGRVVVQLARSAGGDIEFTVADNGPGIPPEMREQIFEIFFSTKGSRGTGLGLACSMKIAQEHGGTLSLLDSSQGACFRLVLPGRIA